MRKFGLVIAACLVSTCAFAQKVDNFYKAQIDDNYWVFGSVYPGSDKQPACFVDNKYVDGSRFQISINPGVAHLRGIGNIEIFFRDNSWEIKGPYGPTAKHKLQLNIFKDKNFIDGGQMEFVLWSKNHIKISNIDTPTFLKTFARGNKMVFVMPGTIINSTVEYKFPKAIINNLMNCVKKFEDLYNDVGEDKLPENRKK